MTDKPLYAEKPQLRINQMYAFIAEDDDGNEGVIAFFNPQPFPQMMPMVGADMDRVASMEAIARKVKAQTGHKIKLVYFSHRQEVREI